MAIMSAFQAEHTGSIPVTRSIRGVYNPRITETLVMGVLVV